MEINEKLEIELDDLKITADNLKLDKYEWITKYKILQKQQKKSKNFTTSIFDKENLEEKIQQLENENEELILTKTVYLEKINELCEKIKIIDDNYYLHLKKNHEKILNLQNINEELQNNFVNLNENNPNSLKRSLTSKTTNFTVVGSRNSSFLNEKLTENLKLKNDYRFSQNEIKKYQNTVLELKQKNMLLRNQISQFNKRIIKKQKSKKK